MLDARGRIAATNEPAPQRGPRLTLIRSASQVAWAVRGDVDDATAARVAALAASEPCEPRAEPVHLARYNELLGGPSDSGPTFAMPELPAQPCMVITTLAPLLRHLRGWTAEELPGCQPIVAICEGDDAVSVCFSARLSATAAEAGVYTSSAHRGRGLASVVTAAWAAAIRAGGRVPIYSTSWTNSASLAVARKLGLVAYASQLDVLDPP